MQKQLLLFSFLIFLIINTTTLFSQENYWQQHVDYKMEIDMNVDNYQYTGNQKLTYTNNSPNTLDKVYYHLYFNAFQPGSKMDKRLKTIPDPDERMVNNIGSKNKPIYESKISKLKNNEIGFIKVNKLKQNGLPVKYSIDGTLLVVELNQPIKPGEKTIFEIDFLGQVPLMIRRAGRNNNEGVELSMAQWYPKMAEYDIQGWHTDPYIGREFYGVWGDFDVKITIDKAFTLGGTGYLQNPQNIGKGYEDPKLPLTIPNSPKLTWHFFAPNVHDFTWAADKNYVHEQLKTKDNVTLHFLYKNEESVLKVWKEMQPYAVKTMEYYSDIIGAYPYKQYSIIQGGDGGMEYGMCTLVNGGKSFMGLTGTVVHEMAHAWFQFALATNESLYPWMDEGFATYVETLAMKDFFKKTSSDFIFQDSYDAYSYMVSTGYEEPLTTHADHYQFNMSYSINAYAKGSVFLSQLAYIIGQDNLEKTLKEYFKLWSGKHPHPNDFIKIAEIVSGFKLDWYLKEFVETTNTVDYAVKKVENKKIVIEKIGKTPMPLEVKVMYDDKTEEFFYIPLSLMNGNKQLKTTTLKVWDNTNSTYTINTTKKVVYVEIDASLQMADVQRKNNIWE